MISFHPRKIEIKKFVAGKKRKTPSFLVAHAYIAAKIKINDVALIFQFEIYIRPEYGY